MPRFPAPLFVAAFVLVTTFYVWICRSDGQPWRFGREQTDYYNLLVDGFLDGELSLEAEVSPELLRSPNPYDPAQRPPGSALHDASLFKGKYYIYYGVAPAAVLMLPFRVVTGVDLPIALGVLIFVCAAYGVTLAILHDVRRRLFPRTGGWLVFCLAIGLGFASCAPVLLRRHSMYELPIASAQFFALGAFWCLMRALWQEKRRLLWLALSSLAWGLTIGSRPHYFLAPVAMFFGAAVLWRRKRPMESAMPILCAAILPIVGIGAALALYNYLRFENPLEFGLSYILSGVYEAKITHFSFRYAAWNFFAYFWAAGEWSRYFPFFHVTEITATRPAQHFGMDAPFGLLRYVPLLWFAACVPLAFRTAGKGGGFDRRLTVGLLAGVTLVVTGMVLCFYAAMARYFGDFAPWLALLSCLGVMALHEHATSLDVRWLRRIVTGAAIVMAAVSAFTVTAYSLRLYHPVRLSNLQTLARLANLPAHWLDRLRGEQRGRASLRVMFPVSAGDNRREELLSTGPGGTKDRIWVVYPDAEHVRLAFEHASAPTIFSEPVRADRTRAHDLRISLGSLYPPESSPDYADLPRAQKNALLRRLFVQLDGKVVLDRYQRFYEGGPGSVRVGGSGPEAFSGRVEAVQYESRAEALAWALEVAGVRGDAPAPDSDGVIRLRVRFPDNVTGGKEPLVVSGETGRGDFLVVEYLAERRLRFILDHWGRRPYLGDALDYVPGREYLVEVTHPAYAPADVDPAEGLPTCVVKVDGATVWELAPAFYPADPEDVFVGYNPIGGSSCGERFTGEITLANRRR